MIFRIDVKSRLKDTRAEVLLEKLNLLNLKDKLQNLEIIDSYNIESLSLDPTLIPNIAGLFTNPITENFDVVFSEHKPRANTIEIAFLPGVTDNVANTASKTILGFLKQEFVIDVYSSKIYILDENVNKTDLELIAASLHNELIQKARINEAGIYIPKVKLNHPLQVEEINLNVSDSELETISKEKILALNLSCMKAIQNYFHQLGRNPRDIELESIAQTWSEHCKHTIFASPIDDISNGLYKTYIQGATNTIRKLKKEKDFCVSVFSDNSGIIEFDENHLLTHKVETHNSPSALDPFGGAITGIVGVNRDTIASGLGAKPVANIYGYCFADPNDNDPLFRDKNLSQKMLSPKRIMEGVIEGVRVGGNSSGIPTVHGFTYFHERFKGKPLVFVGTLGILPKTVQGKPSHLKQANPGDFIVMLGGRVGRDGIHGATFSSIVMDSNSPAAAVQIGDPITQKKLSDALIKEARDLGLYSSITDNGAGGLSCAVAEMARESNGCKVDLDRVPLKYPGLQAWQIWVSESQERITLSVPPDKWNELETLMKSRDVEATVIGKFTDNGKVQVQYQDQSIMDIDLEFLHHGLPKPNLVTHPFKNFEEKKTLVNDFNKYALDLVKNLNYSSTEFISKQYDHEVQGISVLKPIQGRGRVNADSAVIRPILKSRRGVVISSALYPEYSETLGTYYAAAAAIDTTIRNLISTGADPERIALLDNFCWCSANEPERLYQLKEAARACYDYAVAYQTPFISGKDSMFNDFKGYDKNANPINISVLPTLLISGISVIDSVTSVVSIDAKQSGDLVYLIGNPQIDIDSH